MDPETKLTLLPLGDKLHQQLRTYDSLTKYNFLLFPVHQISLCILDLPLRNMLLLGFSEKCIAFFFFFAYM